MPLVLTVLLFGSVIAFAGCDTFNHSEVKVTFLNSTDSLLCDDYYYALPSEGTPNVEAGCSNEVKPLGRITRLPGCDHGAVDLIVTITVASDGREIHNRRATCKEWNDARATFIIKQRGDEFAVTDSLPEN